MGQELIGCSVDVLLIIWDQNCFAKDFAGFGIGRTTGKGREVKGGGGGGGG